jgi:two-component system sensor histidine kinase
MSHEIRTPLNAIVGFSNLLPSAETLEEEKLYSSIINQNSEILLQLINDILDLSKIEAGTLEYVRQPMNLGEVCRNIYQIHKDRVQEGVTLILDNEDDDLIIEEDRNRIAQVITNFLTNAGKFTLSGEIRFGFKVDNQCIRFYVKDTGIGIAPDKVGHIFDRFVKLNSFAQGTGLGLAICRMIIEKIGGEIGATSEVGKGSTFFFTIPYKESSDDRITYSDTSEAKYLSHTIKRMQKIKKILVAEDVDSNFVLIKNMIGKDYTLLWAKDGFEAVEMYKQFQPDLILMDIKMPRMGGLEATRIIRSYSKEIPVIALTAYAFEADKEQALEAGCNDFVTKPVSKAALEEALGKCSG